jgi:hypothetical protein
MASQVDDAPKPAVGYGNPPIKCGGAEGVKGTISFPTVMARGCGPPR